MVEFRDSKQSSRTANQNDGALGGQVFGDAKRDRQDQRKDKENPRPQVQPQDGGRRPHPDFTPPAPQNRENQRPRIQPTDTTRVPQRDQPPRVNPRDQFPNFPNINPGNQRPDQQRPRPDQQRPRPDQPRPDGPRPGENVTPRPRIDFPDLKPNRPVNPTDGNQPRVRPEVKPVAPADRNRPGFVPSLPFNPGDSKPTDQNRLRPDGFNPLKPPNPTLNPDLRPKPEVRPANPNPSPYDFRPYDKQEVRPKVPAVQPRTDVPAVQPRVNPAQPRVDFPAVQPRNDVPAVQPGLRPRVDNPNPAWKTDNNPNPAWQTDNNPNPAWPQTDNSQRFKPQKPNIGNIVQDLLIGPQYPRPGQYSPGGYPDRYNPGYYPQRPTGPAGILNDVVNDLINPGQNHPRPGYNPDYNPNYDPRFDQRNPNYDPRMDARNPNYDPRFDPRNDPRYNPGYDPGYNPRYNPGHNPRFPQNPNNVANRIIGDVIGDLLSPRNGPGCNPGYDQNYPQPDCPPGTYNPGFYPQDYNQPQRFPNGRFPQNGQVREFIRQGIGNLRNNPQGFDQLLSGLGGLLGGDTQFNIDRERGELNLAMDFTRAYDSITQKQGTPPNPEIRRVLGGLDSINLSADAMNLNWKGEQLVTLGDKGQGPAKDFRLLLGGGTNQTSFQIQSNETRLNLSNIQGLEAVDPQGNRLRVHMVDLDTSDPAGPKGSITIDNPVPRPAQLPANVQWPEQVALPIPMNGPEQKQMADALPGMIRTINSARNAAKTGDLSQLTGNLNPGDLANIIGMLKGPRPQPVSPDQYIQPEVPPIPQPEWVPPPPPPEPGIRPDVGPEPEVRVVPDPPEPGIPAEVPVVPQPEVAPQPAEVRPDTSPVAPPPAADTTITPARPSAALEPGAQPLRGGSLLKGTAASLFAPSINRDAPAPTVPAASVEVPPTAEIRSLGNVDYLDFASPAPVAVPQDKPVAPAVQPTEKLPAEQPIVPQPDAVIPIPVAPIPEVAPQPSTTDNAPRGGRSEEFLRANGIKVPEAQKIGAERLFNMIFADADQTGPLVTGFNRALSDTRFRQDVSTIGSTLNRFDVDKSRKSITVGLDFAKAYDTIETDRTKYKPETRQFLSGLESVTITPEQIRLKLNGPNKLLMDGEGLKKADLWLGTDNGETTFDYQTTENSITLKAKGLQAEVVALGKKLNVYEINIDTSTGVASATALIDNPFDKPPGVPESTWSRTMLMPVELGKTAEETAEVNKRLPQTLKSLHAMRQGAQSGALADRIGNLTKEDIIALLKFQ